MCGGLLSYTIFLFYSLYYNHVTNYPTIKLKTTMECKDHVKYPLLGIQIYKKNYSSVEFKNSYAIKVIWGLLT